MSFIGILFTSSKFELIWNNETEDFKYHFRNSIIRVNISIYEYIFYEFENSIMSYDLIFVLIIIRFFLN